MRDIFKYEQRADYPHMSVRDKAIWERFLLKYPDAYKQVQYDFHIGDAPPFNTLDDDDTDLFNRPVNSLTEDEFNRLARLGMI